MTEPDGYARRVVPAPVRARAAGLQLGTADVRREFEDVLRFWFDRGVDGIRIDSAALLCKDPALPDSPGPSRPGPAHPYTDRDEVHEIYQSWRLASRDEYAGTGC